MRPGARTQAQRAAGGRGASARFGSDTWWRYRRRRAAGPVGGGPGWAGSCSSAPGRPHSDSSRGNSKQRHTDPELWFFAAAPGTLLSVSGRRQRGVAGRSGDGSWRRLVSRLRRRLPGAVRGQGEVDQVGGGQVEGGQVEVDQVEVDQVEVDQVEVDQVEVLELSSADSLGQLRGERHGCRPWASGSRSPRRRRR